MPDEEGHMPEDLDEGVQEEAQPEEQNVDELEQRLLDAMRSLSRKNKMVEEYLDNLGRTAAKPPVNPEAPTQ